jgi:uncharacterized protein YjbI with pentapeptide repeats
MPSSPAQGIFLSYRRDDAPLYARLLQVSLQGRFPDARIFMDLDSIDPGLPFAEVIREAVNSCTVLVALIGRQWATLTDDQGGRRLDNPDDYVRFEIRTALERQVRVIPVLIDGASPLRQDQLPAELENLAGLQALKLSNDRYPDDAARLLDIIHRALTPTVTVNQAESTAEQTRARDEEQAEPPVTQIAERFTRAVEQLGGASQDVRLIGLYALEQIHADSEPDRPKIVDVIAAFARSHLPPHSRLQDIPEDRRPAPLPDDIQASLTILGRLEAGQPVDLSGIDCSVDSRYRADLHGANLHDANLSDVDLTGADLIDANLSDADLTGARLSDAYLGRANLNLANLGRANLGRATLNLADLTRATLKRATLTGATLKSATLNLADLSNADLTNADLTKADLTNANLNHARLLGAVLDGAVLREADLIDADLTHATLMYATLTGANLCDANLTDAALTGADMTGAILTNAKGADLTKAKGVPERPEQPHQEIQAESPTTGHRTNRKRRR